MARPIATRAPLRLLSLALGGIGLLAGGGLLALVAGAFRDPAGSLHAVIASSVWAPFGPFLLLAGIAAFALGALARRGGARRTGAVAMALCLTGLLGAGLILGRIGLAATAAGASIDWPASLRLGPMDHPAPDLVETMRNVEGADLRAAFYLPPDPAPVLVYIHGGGFMTGTLTETAADLRWFADRGWLVASIEYRLFEPGRPTWDLATEDVACGLLWVARNAARLGGDPSRLALAGDSAGGNLAINVGFAAASGQASPDCGAPIPVPSAIAVLYPAVDPLSIYRDGFPVPGFEPEMLIEGYIGGPPERFPDRVAAIASEGYLTPLAPPTLIVLPESDSLVVAAGTLAFAERAVAAGVPLDLVRLPFANHVFNQIAANSPGNQIGRTIRLRFLDRHLR